MTGYVTITAYFDILVTSHLMVGFGKKHKLIPKNGRTYPETAAQILFTEKFRF